MIEPAYLSVGEDDEITQGDICLTYMAFTRREGELPPGETFDEVGKIPAYPTEAMFPIRDGAEVGITSGFAIVVTHSCEIDREKNREVAREHWDCRIELAPIIAKSRAPYLNWESLRANTSVGALYLPGVARASLKHGTPNEDWPDAIVDLRAIAVGSRQILKNNRLMRLAPSYLALLQRQLIRFFVCREVSRLPELQSLIGKKLVDAIPFEDKEILVSLLADDGSSAQVRVRPAGR